MLLSVLVGFGDEVKPLWKPKGGLRGTKKKLSELERNLPYGTYKSLFGAYVERSVSFDPSVPCEVTVFMLYAMQPSSFFKFK